MARISQNRKKTFKELSIELTHRCVLNCIYCSSSSNLNKTTALNLKKLIQVIDTAKRKFFINKVSISGGEVFLYPDFLSLYEHLAKEKYKIIIYSSGVVLDKNKKPVPIPREFLKKIRLRKNNPEIIFNICGHNKNLIETINNKPGSFDIIEQSIKNVQAENIYMGANVVPFERNYRYLEKIVDYCQKRNFDEVNFLRFVPQGRGGHYRTTNTPAQLDNINDTLIKILKKNTASTDRIKIRLGHPINFLFLKGKEKLYKEKKHYCRGGLDAPLILPNGDVAMCPAWKDLKQFSAGNIYKQDFSTIWNSTNFNIFRNFIKEGYKRMNPPCNGCIYLKGCRGKCVAQRLLVQSNKHKSLGELLLFAPDPQCFKNLGKGNLK